MMVYVYMNDFFFASNCLNILDILKKAHGWKYSIKDLGEIQTIIGWQIIYDLAT